jgi:DNA ligase-1
MERFTQLFCELDTTMRTAEKVTALERYFADASPRDAAWALFFLSGRKIKRSVSTTLLRVWVAAEAGLPLWLVEESFDAVGDLAETLALLLPAGGSGGKIPLHQLVEERLVPLPSLAEESKRELLLHTWRQLDARERLVWNKLITGEFRVGIGRTLVVRALANVARIPPAVMAQRLMGNWEPTEEVYQALLSGDVSDKNQPYPFYLAYPLDVPCESLGGPEEWLAEWKWDGIRAQLIHRATEVLVWSRGEELMTERFPEIHAAGRLIPDGTVIDGEILAWRDDGPLSFTQLQLRIGRKEVDMILQVEVPVVFMAYDLLEREGKDCRQEPLTERRSRLEAIVPGGTAALRLSPILNFQSWNQLRQFHAQSRGRGVEGVMLKKRESVYGVGRQRGSWWKWKVDPYHVDAVLIYAQQGHGRRASLFTDYTFGVWDQGELVPVAKAYSGLSDEEIREVDAFVRANTIERHGPVRIVRPELVFELAFEAIQASTRHRSGLAVRFPRMARWRRDKRPADADSLETLRALLRAVGS